MSIVRIENLKDHVGAAVTLRGWLYNKTDKGRLQFLQVRDGSGICQAVVFKKNVSEADLEAQSHRRALQALALVILNLAS